MSELSTNISKERVNEGFLDGSENTANSSREIKPTKKVEDLEVKDAQLIFQTVWQELEQEMGAENLKFPAEIFWLNGAPGAGKGT